MSKNSNNKNRKNNEIIFSAGKGVANPITSYNISTSFYEYPAKEQIARKSKSNKFF
ncbi:hypothetical protein JCM1393_07930 [Clostridium carnis]